MSKKNRLVQCPLCRNLKDYRARRCIGCYHSKKFGKISLLHSSKQSLNSKTYNK